MSPVETYTFTFRLPADRQAVFDLFADPGTLDLLTPAWFRLRPLGDRRPALSPGSEISYRLRWRGLPMRWTSRIIEWREPERIVYEQVEGPYRHFRHEHRFACVAAGTEIFDRVAFQAPGGTLVNQLVVLPDLRRIFACRRLRALELLQPETAEAA